MTQPDNKPKGRLRRLADKGVAAWNYVTGGVWHDSRRTFGVSVVKTVSLSVRSFLNGDIQTHACAMTYRTLLAIVPALALMFAVGRGFGLQSMLEDELKRLFPAQNQAIQVALNFVDSYLNQASEGVFVGVGIVFLLYTLISLVSNVEDVFNQVWGVKVGRSLWRKIPDYTAMLLILPVLMICASGMNLMLSSTLRTFLDFKILTPLYSVMLEGGSWVMTWMFFTAMYILMPNTKVRFSNALIAGIFAGTGFRVLQWLFVTGQLYVARYNAIYGGFSFLPLLLLWLQLVWVITLSGAVVCYSSQNIFRFSFDNEVSRISANYRSKATIAIATVIVHRFEGGLRPVTVDEIVKAYNFPIRLVGDVTDLLVRAGVLSRTILADNKDVYGYQPAISPDTLSVGLLGQKLEEIGTRDFIPDFNANFPGINALFMRLRKATADIVNDTLLKDIDIVTLAQHQEAAPAAETMRDRINAPLG